jgi:DNA-binding beta-propeller fold protein YncE
MTTPDISVGALPSETNADGTLPGASEQPAPPEEERTDDRRKKLLLLLLLGLLAIMMALSVWYLLFRKPITELPLPIAQEAMPTYQYAFYDLTKPQGVAVSSDGSRIYVTQTGGSRETLVLDGRGTTLGSLKPPATTVEQAYQLGVAVNPVTGQVWTTDRTDGKVFIYEADGTYVREFDPGLALANWQPLGIGFDQQGDAFIADVGGGLTQTHEFSPAGTLIRDIGASASLDHPNGIAVDGSGNLYVTDTGNGRLLVFDGSGAQVGIVERGTSAGNLGLPVGIGIDDRGHILVADSSGAAVQAYAPIKAGDPGPSYINAFGAEGSTDGAFAYPNGLAADGRGRVYIADWGNDRLQVWSY